MERDKALIRAIELAGGNKALANAIGISPPSLSAWQTCPANRVLSVVNAVGGKVTCHELRPDIYPKGLKV